MRLLISKAFLPHAVEKLRPHIQKIADELLDDLQEPGCLDILMDFAYPLPVIVIAELMGVPTEHRAQELCSLRTDDVNWSAATILVRKTRGGDHRMVGLGANAARCVDSYLRKRQKRSGWPSGHGERSQIGLETGI
jgi:cytochrome P450